MPHAGFREISILRRLFLLLIACGAPALCAAVPAGLLQLPRGTGPVLVADTATSTLRRFALSEHSLVQIDEHYMSIGRNGTGKERAWDRKTPLGIYFITDELDTSRLHARYGDLAFALDYPNAWDRYLARDGDGIWIHGVDRREPERPPLDTDGCIAVPNAPLRVIARQFVPLDTTVIVTRELVWTPRDEAVTMRDRLVAALTRWQRSIEQNDFSAYSELYAEDFRLRGMDREHWLEWRGRVFGLDHAPALQIDRLAIIADPERHGLYLTRFTLRRRDADETVVTLKRLYWLVGASGEPRIVTEDFG